LKLIKPQEAEACEPSPRNSKNTIQDKTTEEKTNHTSKKTISIAKPGGVTKSPSAKHFPAAVTTTSPNAKPGEATRESPNQVSNSKKTDSKKTDSKQTAFVHLDSGDANLDQGDDATDLDRFEESVQMANPDLLADILSSTGSGQKSVVASNVIRGMLWLCCIVLCLGGLCCVWLVCVVFVL
jgi:hypothetical protein